MVLALVVGVAAVEAGVEATVVIGTGDRTELGNAWIGMRRNGCG